MKKKRDDEQNAPPEVESYNEELMSFDLEDVSVEELERRFELAVAQVVGEDGSCGTLFCGDVGCGTFACGTMGPFIPPP